MSEAEERLARIVRGMIGAERSRRKTKAAIALAQAIEGIPAGHSARPIAIDRAIAREYEERASKWLEIIKSAIGDAGFAWTSDRAVSMRALIEGESAVDWEELYSLLEARTKGQGDARIHEFDSAKNRMAIEIGHKIELLVLATEQHTVPLYERLNAPRYDAVRAALTRAKALVNGGSQGYPNAAKEAVSAVEQLGRVILCDNSLTLGDIAKALRGSGKLAPPLLKGIEEIWGWSSGTPSVRHGSSASQTVDASAVNYIIAQSEAAVGLLLSIDHA